MTIYTVYFTPSTAPHCFSLLRGKIYPHPSHLLLSLVIIGVELSSRAQRSNINPQTMSSRAQRSDPNLHILHNRPPYHSATYLSPSHSSRSTPVKLSFSGPVESKEQTSSYNHPIRPTPKVRAGRFWRFGTFERSKVLRLK